MPQAPSGRSSGSLTLWVRSPEVTHGVALRARGHRLFCRILASLRAHGQYSLLKIF